jgi:hypothetical protein
VNGLHRLAGMALLVAMATGSTGCRALCGRWCAKQTAAQAATPVAANCATCNTGQPQGLFGHPQANASPVDGGYIVGMDGQWRAPAGMDLATIPEGQFVPIPSGPQMSYIEKGATVHHHGSTPGAIQGEVIQHPSPPPRQSAPRNSTEPAAPQNGVQAGLNVSVRAQPAVVKLGSTVTFDITLRNQGQAGQAISSVDLSATVGDNLEIESITPANSGDFDKSSVVFKTLKNLTGGVELTYSVNARVVGTTGGVGQIEVEVRSPILTSGVLRHQAVTRIDTP